MTKDYLNMQDFATDVVLEAAQNGFGVGVVIDVYAAVPFLHTLLRFDIGGNRVFINKECDDVLHDDLVEAEKNGAAMLVTLFENGEVVTEVFNPNFGKETCMPITYLVDLEHKDDVAWHDGDYFSLDCDPYDMI